MFAKYKIVTYVEYTYGAYIVYKRRNIFRGWDHVKGFNTIEEAEQHIKKIESNPPRFYDSYGNRL